MEKSKGSLQYFPKVDIKKWLSKIMSLTEGIEVISYRFEPHITIAYGLDDSCISNISSLLNEFLKESRFELSIHKLNTFRNENDILVIPVYDHNENIVKLNRIVETGFNIQSSFDFSPHITIAVLPMSTGYVFVNQDIDIFDYGIPDINIGVFKYQDSNRNKINL
ncbi:MAG: 2'-5' RNA ligase family protein [Sphingobacterium sp.]|jgi:2'-5' RNA ligase|nr:2'-5' RNA ligase family protein [Sphingobacterium sp.]